MSPTITQILVDLALVTVPLALPPLAIAATGLLRTHVSSRHLATAMAVADQVVAAVEQLGVATGWTSQFKRTQALSMAQDLLARQGVNLTNAQVSTLIEASVAAMKQTHGELSEPIPIVAPSSPLLPTHIDSPRGPIPPPTPPGGAY